MTSTVAVDGREQDRTIYWVFFKYGHNQLKIQVEAVERVKAIDIAKKIAKSMNLNGIIWQFDDIQACR